VELSLFILSETKKWVVSKGVVTALLLCLQCVHICLKKWGGGGEIERNTNRTCLPAAPPGHTFTVPLKKKTLPSYVFPPLSPPLSPSLPPSTSFTLILIDVSERSVAVGGCQSVWTKGYGENISSDTTLCFDDNRHISND
jgi:hypothetical protein